MSAHCIVRPPIEICGENQPTGVAGLSIGITPFDRGDRRADRSGTVAISWLSFVTTNGVDFTTATRRIELALVDGSGKLFSGDPNFESLATIPNQSILFEGVASTVWIPYVPALPVPIDVAGPLLQRLRWRVDAAAGGFNWCIRVGLVETFGEAR